MHFIETSNQKRTRVLSNVGFMLFISIIALDARAIEPLEFTLSDGYSVPHDVYHLESADFNRDGLPDLAAGVGYDYRVAVLLNQGDGTFSSSLESSLDAAAGETTGRLMGLVSVNLPGDTVPDLVVGDYYNGKIKSLAGNGDGTFTLVGSVPAGKVEGDVISGDFNHDGIADAAACTDYGAGRFVVLLGNAAGSFNPANYFPLPEGCASLDTGLINNDPHLDLVTANLPDDSFSVHLGDGLGGFRMAGTFKLCTMGCPTYDIELGDMDRDGFLDVVWGVGNGISIFPGDGQGNFFPDGSGDVLYDQLFFLRGYPAQVKIHDLDNNGWMDWAATSKNGAGVAFSLAFGYSHFTDPFIIHEEFDTGALVVDDFNLDSVPDLAVSFNKTADPFLAVFWGATADYDLDLLSDDDELLYGTSISGPDTDGDLMPDGFEIDRACLDPLSGDSMEDSDADTLVNIFEFYNGLNPCSSLDTDADTLPDDWERFYGCMEQFTVDDILNYDGDQWTNEEEFANGHNPCQSDLMQGVAASSEDDDNPGLFGLDCGMAVSVSGPFDRNAFAFILIIPLVVSLTTRAYCKSSSMKHGLRGRER